VTAGCRNLAADSGTVSCLLVVLATIVYAEVGGALSWDGSSYLFRTLHEGSPAVFHDRYGAASFLVPTWLMSHLTDDVGLLSKVFSISFALPAVAIFAVLVRLNRDRPRSLSYGAIGLALVTVPVQFFAVSEALLVTQLAWLLVAILQRRPSPASIICCIVVSGTLVLLHPAAVFPLATLAIAHAWIHRHDEWYAYGPLLAVAAVLAFSRRTAYDKDMGSGRNLEIMLGGAVSHAPITALALANLAAFAVYRTKYQKVSRWRWLPLVFAAVSGLVLIGWAWSGASWEQALDYRVVVIIASLPLWVLALVDTEETDTRSLPVHSATLRVIPLIAAVTFCFVLFLQSFQWHSAVSSFKHQLATSPTTCIDSATLPSRGPIKRFWTTPALAADLQGRRPMTFVLTAELCRQVERGGSITSGFGGYPLGPGWFSLDPQANRGKQVP